MSRAGLHRPASSSSVRSREAPAANKAQSVAASATKQAEYWQAGTVPMLDLVPDGDPFKPKEKWNESREEFGRVRRRHSERQPRADPGATRRRRRRHPGMDRE